MHPPLTFLWPQLLSLLWTIPMLALAYVWLLRSRRQPVLRYASLATVRLAMPSGGAWRRHLPPALLLLALTVLLLAAARPLGRLPLPTQQATVMLAIDVSLSMQADDIRPSRLDAARDAAKAFVRRLPDGVRVGIVSFAGTAHLVQPATYSRELQLAAIDRLHLLHGTAMGSGMVLALAELFPDAAIDLGGPDAPLQQHHALPSGQTAPIPVDTSTAIVLLTDGRSNFGVHPLQAADMAARRGVRIHAVGLGSVEPDAGGLDDWSAVLQLDEDMLREVTRRTRGEYFHAGSAQALMRIYEQMGSRLALRTRDTELAAPLALAALVLMGSAAGLSLLWLRRVA